MPRRYDIVENPNRSTRELYPFLLVLQHDRVMSVQSVVVAPLVPVHRGPAPSRLHPVVDVDGSRFSVLTEDLGSVQRSQLKHVVASAEDQHYEITAAIDMLFTGV